MRPDAKDQADGDHEDSWNRGSDSCVHSFTESWGEAALSEIELHTTSPVIWSQIVAQSKRTTTTSV